VWFVVKGVGLSSYLFLISNSPTPLNPIATGCFPLTQKNL
jgi:hypothetical protein